MTGEEDHSLPFVLSCSNCKFIITDSFQTLLFKNDEIITIKPDRLIKNNDEKNILFCECKQEIGYLKGDNAYLKAEKLTVYKLGNLQNDKKSTNSLDDWSHQRIVHEIKKLQQFCVWLSGKIERE
ncbi:hypothetical protein M153_17200000322 [Pseudoloma neurophilia]|uniref:Protein yippee-like n=1 Tax=Pseudoloma neurophilia TaxID=146866 RepID=A0A0R0LR17_9MICR|nr:hypothetical protein M153_17200000322 [Pseudoloma neurophilia]